MVYLPLSLFAHFFKIICPLPNFDSTMALPFLYIFSKSPSSCFNFLHILFFSIITLLSSCSFQIFLMFFLLIIDVGSLEKSSTLKTFLPIWSSFCRTVYDQTLHLVISMLSAIVFTSLYHNFFHKLYTVHLSS